MASKDKIPEKVQEAIFNKILSRPADGECADCRNKSPTWVSLDFGVFVCIRCSGVHRQLGPHITRVRSTRLDGWTKDNIEIMEAIGNKLANDFYEYRMPSGYRKPGPNSSPEECRRFVDEKYIRKAFAPSGHQEPVKEFLACRNKGIDPEFGYSKSHQQDKANDGTKILRKKSMSLDRLPEPHPEGQKKAPQQQHQQQQQQHQQPQHHHQDLLSADDDLLGHDDGFGDFKQGSQSASPPFKSQNLKKVHSDQDHASQNQWNWNFDANQQNQNQNQNQQQMQNQNQNQQQNINFSNNNNNASPPQQNMQKPAENKVDFMKLYNQPQMGQMQGHQNHFVQMQGMQQQNPGWNAHHHTQWHSANHASNYGMQQQQQNQFHGGFQQQQNFQNQGGFNQNAGFNAGMGYGNNMGNMGNMGGNMGGMQNMGYGYGQGQGQMQGQYNAFPNNNNFAQQQMSGNRFF